MICRSFPDICFLWYGSTADMQYDHDLKDLGELDEPPVPTEVLVSRIYSARRLRRRLARVP